MQKNPALKPTNQWADLNEPQSPDAIEIRKDLALAPSIGFERIAQVESYAKDVLPKVGHLYIKSTVEFVIGEFIDHSATTFALFDEINAFYQEHGIPEDEVEWFTVKEIMRILLASPSGRRLNILRRKLHRHEFENANLCPDG